MEHCQGWWIVKSCPWEGQVTVTHSYTHKWVASDYVLPSKNKGFLDAVKHIRNPPSPMTYHFYGWFRKTPGGRQVSNSTSRFLSGVGSFARRSWLEHPPYLWLMFPSKTCMNYSWDAIMFEWFLADMILFGIWILSPNWGHRMALLVVSHLAILSLPWDTVIRGSQVWDHDPLQRGIAVNSIAFQPENTRLCLEY